MTPSIVDPPGTGAYPIASFTWLVVPARMADEDKRTALTGFLRWMRGLGQKQAAALGYVALPADMATRAEARIMQIR